MKLNQTQRTPHNDLVRGTAAAVNYLGGIVSRKTIERLCATRSLPHYRVGRLHVFKPADLDRLLERGRVEEEV